MALEHVTRMRCDGGTATCNGHARCVVDLFLRQCGMLGSFISQVCTWTFAAKFWAPVTVKICCASLHEDGCDRYISMKILVMIVLVSVKLYCALLGNDCCCALLSVSFGEDWTCSASAQVWQRLRVSVSSFAVQVLVTIERVRVDLYSHCA